MNDRYTVLDLGDIDDMIQAIHKGVAEKMKRENVTVYRVKNVIRVDIKEEN